MIRQVAEYAVWEHDGRPWPDKSHGIPVVPVITRHTPLLAVVYSEVDNDPEDRDLEGSALNRVVFTLTAVSQVHKTAARMADHLHNAISFNTDLFQIPAEDIGSVHLNEFDIEFDESYIQDGEEYEARGLPRVGEIETQSEPQEFGNVRMDSCYAERRSLFYDPGLDVWKGSITFIADMYDITEIPNREI